MDIENTKITVEIGDVKSTWETPASDITIPEFLEGLYGVLVAQGFPPLSVIKGMVDFAYEHSGSFKADLFPNQKSTGTNGQRK
jgi:hypothetical protein